MPLDRLFPNKRVTSRGDTEILARAQLISSAWNREQTHHWLKVAAQSLPAPGAAVTSHLWERRCCTEIPYGSRHYGHPSRDKKSPHFPAFIQPGNSPVHFCLAVRCVTCRFGSNFSQSHVSGKNICKKPRISENKEFLKYSGSN